ncbi:hypothetical protein LWI28_006170 [Acer negundo]|uniref:Retrotransposon gag domain-containing protein n=1 Tax=Acer negundo TaxID=4023 RepID=A0AAD5P5K5_ACENE|nr:hypothetical protein LWI28_006170 [Acer negundo]
MHLTPKERMGDMALQDPNLNRTLMDYSAPFVATSPSCFVRPPITANHFELKSSFIQMLQSFYGNSNEDPNLHIKEFLQISETVKINGVTEEAIKLRLFPFSLKDKAKSWLHTLPPNSITTWTDMANKFLQKYFPPSKMVQLRNDIMIFIQHETEVFYESWERFKEKLLKCPHHGLPEWL